MIWRWPWQPRRETRQSGFYSEAVAELIRRMESGESGGDVLDTGALEACAGLVGRCFASADVQGSDTATDALQPGFLATVGRELIRCGECVYALDTANGRLNLLPASTWDVYGDPSPDSWEYRCDLVGPNGHDTRTLPASGVLHFRYAVRPDRPWEGLGPLQVANLAGRLAANANDMLADETGGPRGSLLPLPGTDGNDDSVEGLKSDIKTAGGAILFVESMATGWDQDGQRRGPGQDWVTKRFGAMPDGNLVQLRMQADQAVFDACGVPRSLFSDGDGTAQRESYRRFLHGTLSPLADLAAAELSEKLESDIRLTFEGLYAADLAGRARAFQSLVKGGMDVAKAAALAGLMEPDGA